MSNPKPSTHVDSSEKSSVSTQQFEFGPWTLTASRSHILQSKCSKSGVCDQYDDSDSPYLCACCRYQRQLKLPQLPEMVFAQNVLHIQHTAGFGIEFNPLDALKRVNNHQDLEKVAGADAWKAARAGSEYIQQIVKPYDWTYTTDYKGTLIGAENGLIVLETSERIDLEKLKQREKIMFYEEILLYEDELADNGAAICSVKIRVMPSSFFVLLRFYLRVDNVLIRIIDTRLYHEADKNYILREYSTRESKVEKLKVPPSLWRDPNEMWQHLPIVEEMVHRLEFIT